VEYQVSQWLAANLPGERIFLTGAPRLWSLAFFDVPQVGGGSEQGLLNPIVQAAQWELNLGPDPKASAAWLQALGATAVVVHGPQSKEQYHDMVTPDKFKSNFELLHDDRADNYIYRTPRKFPGVGRVIRLADSRALPLVSWNPPLEVIQRYAAVAEGGPDRRVEIQRAGSDSFVLKGSLAAGDAFLIQENFDDSWLATENGRRLTIECDSLGFMRVLANPGEHRIQFNFKTPTENVNGLVLSWLTVMFLAGYSAYGWRRAPWL
jgi:hypothetical protein